MVDSKNSKKINGFTIVLGVILVISLQGCQLEDQNLDEDVDEEDYKKTLEEIKDIQEGIEKGTYEVDDPFTGNNKVEDALKKSRALQEGIQEGFLDIITPLEVVNWDWVYEGGSVPKYVEGTVNNNMDHGYRDLKVRFELYDENKNSITIVTDTLSNLEPKGTWKFKAPILESGDKVTNARLMEITGFPL